MKTLSVSLRIKGWIVNFRAEIQNPSG